MHVKLGCRWVRRGRGGGGFIGGGFVKQQSVVLVGGIVLLLSSVGQPSIKRTRHQPLPETHRPSVTRSTRRASRSAFTTAISIQPSCA